MHITLCHSTICIVNNNNITKPLATCSPKEEITRGLFFINMGKIILNTLIVVAFLFNSIGVHSFNAEKSGKEDALRPLSSAIHAIQEKGMWRSATENAEVMIKYETKYYKVSKRAKELKAALERIGFKKVGFYTDSHGERAGCDISILLEDDKKPYSYNKEHKADTEKCMYGSRRRVFEWANEGKRLAEVINPARFEELASGAIDEKRKRLEARQESCITGEIIPSVAAEFIARKVVESLKDVKGPLLPGNEVMVTLPEYEGHKSDKAKQQEEAEEDTVSVALVGFDKQEADNLTVSFYLKYKQVNKDRTDSTAMNIGEVSEDEALESAYDIYILNWPLCSDPDMSLDRRINEKFSGATILVYNPKSKHKDWSKTYSDIKGDDGDYFSSGIDELASEVVEDCDIIAGLRRKELEAKKAEDGLTTDEREHAIKMARLLRSEEIHIIKEDEYEKAVTKKSAIKFRKKPEWRYLDEKRPVLVFENFRAVSSKRGKLVLKEDDEIEIEFDKISGEKWKAVVVVVEEDYIACTVPYGFTRKEFLAQATSGTIRKKYNGAQARAKLKFIRSILGSIKFRKGDFRSVEDKYPLVNMGLGLKPLDGAPLRKSVDMVALSKTGKKIANDKQQLQLMTAGLNGTAIELGWGPAGTGKTYDASEIAYHDNCLGKSLIVGAQTNRAVDNLLIELKKKGIKVYRLGNHKHVIDPLLWDDWLYPEPIKPKEPHKPSAQEGKPRERYLAAKERYSKAMDEWIECHQAWRKFRNKALLEIKNGKAVVGGTCMTIGLERKKLLGDIVFDKCIVEEGSIASFTELLMVFAVAREAALVIGDHVQLGIQPIQDEIIKEMKAVGVDPEEIKNLNISLYEFLLNEGIFNVTMLENCYRMTPLLVELANYNYDDKLNAVRDVSPEVNHNSLIVIDTKNLKERREDDSRRPSWFNILELRIMEKILRGLGKIGIDTEWLGNLTPYAEQIKEIKKLQRNLMEEVFGFSQDRQVVQEKARRKNRLSRNTGTIYIAQGREFPVVIVSAVRSNTDFTTGFMSKRMWHTINTRTQDCLIVIFDSENFLKTWDNKEAVGFIKHMLMLAKREKNGGIYIELTPENPWPDLTGTFHVLQKHLPATYGEAKMPLYPEGSSKTGLGADVIPINQLNAHLAISSAA